MNIHIAYDIVKKYFKSDPSIYRKFMTSYRKYSKSPFDNVEAMNSAEEVLENAFKSHENGKSAKREYDSLVKGANRREFNYSKNSGDTERGYWWENLAIDNEATLSFYDNASKMLN